MTSRANSKSKGREVRVVIFKERLDPYSGFSKHVLEVSRRLLPQGYRFLILTTQMRISSVRELPIEPGMAVFALGGHPYGYMRTRARAIRALLRDEEPDLLDVHGGPGTVLVSRPWGVPWVFSLHAGWFSLRDLRAVPPRAWLREPKLWSLGTLLNVGLSLRGLARALRSRSPRAVAVPTRSLKEALEPLLDCPVWHIPSGVDPGLALGLPPPEAAREGLGLPPEAPVILFYGKAQLLRGVDALLEAFARVAAVHPEARLALVLRPDAAERRITQLVARHPARARILRVSRTTDPRPYLAAADVVALPFRTAIALPAQPLTLLEAMACGKPVISTEIPPVREIVTHGRDGLLVPPGDPEMLAERILWAIENPKEARRLGERARERVLNEYSWNAIAERTHAFYRRALEGGA